MILLFQENQENLMPIVDPENDYKKEDIKEEQGKYPFESWLKNWAIYIIIGEQQ